MLPLTLLITTEPSTDALLLIVAPGALTIKSPLIFRLRRLMVPVAFPLIVTFPFIVLVPVAGP